MVGSSSPPPWRGEIPSSVDSEEAAKIEEEEDYSFSETVPVMCPGAQGGPIPHS